jgi:hypothetical protein
MTNTPASVRKNPPWCIQTIYCDESGNTGNELLDLNQEHFVYASVALEPREAELICTKLKSRNRLQGAELKGKNLLGHERGRRAIDELIALVGERAHLVMVQQR